MEYQELKAIYDKQDWDWDKFHLIQGEYGWDLYPPLQFPAQDYGMWGIPTFEMAIEYLDLFGRVVELNRSWYD